MPGASGCRHGRARPRSWSGPPPGHSTLAAHCVPGGKRVLWRLERAGLVEADAGWGDLYRITRAGRGALEPDRSPSPPDAPDAGNQEAGR
jgi:hypothetical protein